LFGGFNRQKVDGGFKEVGWIVEEQDELFVRKCEIQKRRI